MEAANSIINTSYKTGKSKRLILRQEGQDLLVIAFCDRANEKIRKKVLHMLTKGKEHNKIKGAIARILICYIWALMMHKDKEMVPDKISING